MPLSRLLLAAAMLANQCVAAAPVPADLADAQLRAINHRFVDAFAAPAGRYMAELTHDDFLFTANDGTWIARDGFLTRMNAAGGLQGVSYDDVDVRLFGDVALVHGLFRGLAPAGVVRVRYTDVYVWEGERWRLVSAQNTTLKPDVASAQQRGAPIPLAKWQGQEPTGDDDTVLHALNRRYVQAFRDADAAWYDAHLAPDYIVVNPDGSYHDRAAALANFAKPVYATHLASFPVDKVQVRRFGDVALIHAENAWQRKDGRRGVSRYTDIWVKRDGTWRCVAAHITEQAAPPG